MKHYKIEVHDGDEITVSEFIVIQDNIGIVEHYIEWLEYNEQYYVVYIDGVETISRLDGAK